MDTMKLFLSLVTAAVVGLGSIEKPTDNRINERETVLVAEWPMPQPQTHPVVESEPKSLRSAESDELRKLSQELAADVVKLKQAADAQRELAGGFESYRPKPDASTQACECTCDCDCPDEARLRVILREELANALRTRMQSTSNTSGGSSGNVVMQSAPAVSSGGSSGVQSTVVSSSGYYQPATPYYSSPVYSQPTETVYSSVPATTQVRTYTGPLGVTRSRTVTAPQCRIINGRRVCN